MNIVVTGGGGYIGAHLCLHLAKSGYKVIPVCHKKPPSSSYWVNKMHKVLLGDLTRQKIYDKIRGENPDCIIHLVSLNHFDSEKESGFVTDINVKPTWKLLELCEEKEINKFIYFSTAQVYGKPEPIYIDENTPPKPQNNYGLTHYLSENIGNYYNRKIDTDVINVRLSNSYGSPIFKENNCWWLAVNDLCKGAFYNKKITLQSDGSPMRDFIHMEDVCNSVSFLLKKISSSESNTYLLSSGITYTLMEVALIIQSVYQEKYHDKLPIYTPSGSVKDTELTKNNSNRFTFDNSKIQKLGFEPDYNLQKGVVDLFNYFDNITDQNFDKK